jgi:hypothetical protein
MALERLLLELPLLLLCGAQEPPPVQPGTSPPHLPQLLLLSVVICGLHLPAVLCCRVGRPAGSRYCLGQSPRPPARRAAHPAHNLQQRATRVRSLLMMMLLLMMITKLCCRPRGDLSSCLRHLPHRSAAALPPGTVLPRRTH